MSISSLIISEEYLQELAKRGEAVYSELKQILEPEYNGQHIAIHVETGDYTVAKFSTLAARELSRRHSIDGRIYSRQIGPDLDTDFVARAAALEVLAGRCTAELVGRFMVQLEIQTSYQQLSNFSNELLPLARGGAHEAVLLSGGF